MRTLLLIAAVVLLLTDRMVVRAADRKFPYEAIVDVEDGEVVRSGGGPKFYATDKLRKGDRVMVHRHDPGGWCMITPPPGSFSWVRAEYIQKSGNGTGVLKTSGVVVHTGSTLQPDNFTTIQSSLSQGDAVEILGEKNFSTEDGPRLMYKINPVKREWRWIARKSIVAADEIKPDPFPAEQPPRKKRTGPVAQLDADAFAKPVSTRPIQPDEVLESSTRHSDRSSDEIAVRQTGPESEVSASARKQLDEIDRQFKEMIHQDPSTWDLDSLENQYRRLDDDVGQASMTSTVSLRQDAVKRYRKIHQDYVDFFKLTSDTKQRDAQLQAQQSVGSGQPVGSRQGAGGSEEANPVRQPNAQQPAAPRSGQPPAAAAAAPAFDGAGIVQKMAQTFPGGPQFVLITPEGRMLSFLQPAPGVDLNRHVGRAMGITGPRVHRDDWNADIITVRSLQPVQLRGTR
jgi:hypothetical protein